MFVCPKCGLPLNNFERSFKCPNGHCYDISSQGYVNLLLGNKKNAVHGDNKLMVSARRRFLSLGNYAVIIQKLFYIIESFVLNKNLILIDAGCGEGYYTNALTAMLDAAGYNISAYGLDVSKEAVALASKTYKNISFVVGSVNALPFSDNSADILLSVFAPISEKEFFRILKGEGILITVSPSPRHLYGLKEMVYDKVYENPPPKFASPLFNKVEEESVLSDMTLSSPEQVNDLFTMTPYFYKTGAKEQKKLQSISSLTTEIGFVFCVYKKQPYVG